MTKQVQNSGNGNDKMQLTRSDANTLVYGRRSLLVGAAAVIAAAFVANHYYGPLTEGPRDTKAQPTATATAAPSPRIEVRDKKPTPNDGKCEVDRGEHDPLSGYFNENDCGYCGNDKVDGPWEEEKGETPCYYDLHRCGNGTLDKKATYSVWTKKSDGSFEMKDPKEKEGESCIKGAKNYCDGPECGVKQTHVTPGTVSTAVPAHTSTPSSKPTGTPAAVGPCPQTGAISNLQENIKNELKKHAGSMRKKLAKDNSAIVEASCGFFVSGTGDVSPRGCTTTCTGNCNSPSASGPAVSGVMSNTNIGAIPEKPEGCNGGARQVMAP